MGLKFDDVMGNRVIHMRREKYKDKISYPYLSMYDCKREWQLFDSASSSAKILANAILNVRNKCVIDNENHLMFRGMGLESERVIIFNVGDATTFRCIIMDLDAKIPVHSDYLQFDRYDQDFIVQTVRKRMTFELAHMINGSPDLESLNTNLV